MFRIKFAVPSTPLSIVSGNVADINDFNSSTKCTVAGVYSTYFFFTMDLLQPRLVEGVDLLQWNETGANTGWSIQYSDSPLTGGNQGTIFGTTFSGSATPIDTTRSGSASGRYWGILREGNWSGNNISVGSFDLYTATQINLGGLFTFNG